jgi:preprotein translocase subunit YajC
MSLVLQTRPLQAEKFFAVAAQEKAPVATAAAPAGDGSGDTGQQTPANPLGNPLFLFAILGVFLWLMVLRPQKREKQEKQKKLDAMKKGDQVISIGGIHGKITEVHPNQNAVSVEVCPKVIIKFSKLAIQTVVPKGSEKAESEEPAKDDADTKKK